MPRPHLRTQRNNMHNIKSALCHLHPPTSALRWTHAAHSSPITRLIRNLRVCPRYSPLQYLSLQHKSTIILAARPRPAALSSSHEMSDNPAHQLSAPSYRPRTPEHDTVEVLNICHMHPCAKQSRYVKSVIQCRKPQNATWRVPSNANNREANFNLKSHIQNLHAPEVSIFRGQTS